jgi:hypothetical protein
MPDLTAGAHLLPGLVQLPEGLLAGLLLPLLGLPLLLLPGSDLCLLPLDETLQAGSTGGTEKNILPFSKTTGSQCMQAA